MVEDVDRCALVPQVGLNFQEKQTYSGHGKEGLRCGCQISVQVVWKQGMSGQDPNTEILLMAISRTVMFHCF